MHDSDIEGLLKKYRPGAPPSALEARLFQSLDPQIVHLPSQRTWPWAVAAAALLAVTVVLHASSIAAPTPPEEVLDVRHVQMLVEQIGGSDARAVAEYVVRQEQRADAEAEQARLSEASRDPVIR